MLKKQSNVLKKSPCQRFSSVTSKAFHSLPRGTPSPCNGLRILIPPLEKINFSYIEPRVAKMQIPPQPLFAEKQKASTFLR